MPESQNSSSSNGNNNGNYGAEQIRILEGLEAVRKRPSMYIGDTGIAGLHHLVWEAVDNSIDEAMAGRATIVSVRVNADGSVSVSDDGSGIPVDLKKHDNPLYDGKPAVELVMTVLHAGGKFGEDDSAYKVSGGLHGVGISCVNALSEWLEVEVHRDGKIYKIVFERGAVSEPLKIVGDLPAETAHKTGTIVTFRPDSEIFPDTTYNYETLEHRLRELAYLNPGVNIRITDERVGADGQIKEASFKFNNGIAEYVAHINQNKNPMHDVIFVKGGDDSKGYTVELALQYSDSYNEITLTFANNIRTIDGGTHLSGFKTAITRCLNAYSKRVNLLKEKDPTPTGDDLREGLAAVVSVKLPEPQFEGQTKGKLRNTDVEGFVSSMVHEKLGQWLEEHPAQAKQICLKGVLAAQAREAARRARDLTRRKSALESGAMPHKLRDCTTKDVARSEMFIVEGDSAGGSATQGRDVETQAILPLRGKLLNVERARLDKILAFEELRTLISALKCGIGEEFDVAKLRYGRVIIMTDADVDGSHIRTLLLTFFFRQMPELIRRNRVYIAQPPLYLIQRGKREQYVLNERELTDTLADFALDGASFVVRDTLNVDPETGFPCVLHTHTGDSLGLLVKTLRRLAELAGVVERRGILFIDMLSSRSGDPEDSNRLPTHRITWSTEDRRSEAYAWSDEHAEKLIESNGLRHEVIEGEVAEVVKEADERPVAVVRELHENRELALLFDRLSELHVDIDDYGAVQEEDVTGAMLPTKYAWVTPKKTKKASSDDGEAGAGDAPSGNIIEAANIPEILNRLLDVGRRGMEIKRFKGLGEMDPEQLWETTMDPDKRTLMRVNWDEASCADELFAILMGENVEPRRAYIEKHALEVKSLDV